MKEVIFALSILGLSYLIGLLFPWYAYIPVIIVVSALFDLSKWKKFMIAFLSISFLWSVVMVSKMNADNGVLGVQISKLFEGISVTALSGVTYIIAGFFGGIAALLGDSFIRLFKNKIHPNK